MNENVLFLWSLDERSSVAHYLSFRKMAKNDFSTEEMVGQLAFFNNFIRVEQIPLQECPCRKVSQG